MYMSDDFYFKSIDAMFEDGHLTNVGRLEIKNLMKQVDIQEGMIEDLMISVDELKDTMYNLSDALRNYG